MLTTYRQLTKEKEVKLTHQINELVKKINRLEERYVSGEIDIDVFIYFKEKFITERKELELCLEKFSTKLSNPESTLDKFFSICSKLTSLWISCDYSNKQMLQSLVFPEGILYNRKNDSYRTPRVNSLFAQNAMWAKVLHNKKAEALM